ncbi:hypothetical protein AXG93_3817s1090 [Marchantia polymorpha subsp. ruderalis]|uniref:Uncharacterized protein n=1 Tax=Marchantia polymorpha subsp. ruderalis TaxID=1480154 RepID=A0A176W0F7_MARPO|nr:hypothetical protein AXG93_3817s1090 [Marchantia polymorpha subsp. ruderalis]
MANSRDRHRVTPMWTPEPGTRLAQPGGEGFLVFSFPERGRKLLVFTVRPGKKEERQKLPGGPSLVPSVPGERREGLITRETEPLNPGGKFVIEPPVRWGPCGVLHPAPAPGRRQLVPAVVDFYARDGGAVRWDDPWSAQDGSVPGLYASTSSARGCACVHGEPRLAFVCTFYAPEVSRSRSRERKKGDGAWVTLRLTVCPSVSLSDCLTGLRCRRQPRYNGVAARTTTRLTDKPDLSMGGGFGALLMRPDKYLPLGSLMSLISSLEL